MSASLVGSEMCIRDSACVRVRVPPGTLTAHSFSQSGEGKADASMNRTCCTKNAGHGIYGAGIYLPET
eukprot:7524987-Alexandrium_andersonii.AAC.1